MFFLCVLILSQVTITTTTPPVTVACSRASLIIRSAGCGFTATVDSRDIMMASAGLMNVLQQQQSQSWIPSQAYANYAIGPSQVSFSFRVDPPLIVMSCVGCLLWCLLSAFRFPCGCHVPILGLYQWVL